MDDTYVYWADCTTSKLMRVPIRGGSSTTLVDGEGAIAGIAVDATYVYWIDAKDYGITCAVRKLPLRGGTPTTLASGFEIGEFVVGATSVIFTNYVGCFHSTTGHVGYELISVPIEGGAPTTLFCNFSEEAYPTGVTTDGTNIYWSHGRFPADICDATMYSEEVHGGTVLKIPLGGGTPTTLASGGRQPFGIVVDDTNIYWTDNGSSIVMSVPIDGGTPTTLASCQDERYGCPDSPGFIAMDGTYVYWAENGQMLRRPLEGGTPTTLATLGALGALAIDANNLYWVDLGDRTLMKLRLH